MTKPHEYDLLVAGRPSVDIMFAGLHEWPALGKDIDADGLGICAGTSFNTPAAANRLGLRVGYIAMIGRDRWSGMVRDEFEREGLPTDFLRTVERPLPFISVALNYGRDRGFVTYIDDVPEEDEELERYAHEVIGTAVARHFHGYAGESAGLAALARRRGMSVSLDAWGGPWMESDGPLEQALGEADVLLANEAEALTLTGASEPYAAMATLARHYPCVVVKRGPDGAVALAGADAAEVRGEPVDVLDTTGAGDCFNAGFLLGWLARLPLQASLTLGNLCGARAVGAYGGYKGCPRENELRALAAERGIALPAPARGGAT